MFVPGGTSPTVLLVPSSDTPVLETIAHLLQAHTEAMAAQDRVVALQHLLLFLSFTWEGKEALDNGFELWLEKFQQLADYAGWSLEEQLYQLKSRLDKTAQEVFRMITEEDKRTIESDLSSLKRRFQPNGIEELCGLEFHPLCPG